MPILTLLEALFKLIVVKIDVEDAGESREIPRF